MALRRLSPVLERKTNASLCSCLLYNYMMEAYNEMQYGCVKGNSLGHDHGMGCATAHTFFCVIVYVVLRMKCRPYVTAVVVNRTMPGGVGTTTNTSMRSVAVNLLQLAHGDRFLKSKGP